MTRSLLIVTILALFAGLLGVSPALAQGDDPAAFTITTIGSGEATAPAESAELEFLIADESAFFGGPPTAPQPEATPGAAARAAVAPVADAIAASDGVESVAVVVLPISSPYEGPPPALARIDVTMTNPDQASLSSLGTAAAQAAAGERLLVLYVGARFGTSDCQALEQAAREAALEDARARAQAQANVLGVTLGDVVATRDIATSSPLIDIYGAGGSAASSNCDPDVPMINIEFPGSTLPRFDPALPSAEVEIYRTVEVTFAMTGSEATPAS